jgi:hypothetical protein
MSFPIVLKSLQKWLWLNTIYQQVAVFADPIFSCQIHIFLRGYHRMIFLGGYVLAIHPYAFYLASIDIQEYHIYTLNLIWLCIHNLVFILTIFEFVDNFKIWFCLSGRFVRMNISFHWVQSWRNCMIILKWVIVYAHSEQNQWDHRWRWLILRKCIFELLEERNELQNITS